MPADKYAADRDEHKNDNIIARATQLAKDLQEAEAAVEEAEELLKKRKAVVFVIEHKRLPELFADMDGATEITVQIAGVKYPLVYEEKMAAKLSEAKKDVVFAHMRAQGFDNLINSNIVVPFTKGQAAEMKEFLEYLNSYEGDITVGQKEEIAPSTYTSWCDNNLKDNPSVDLADFGAHIVKRVKLGKPKTSKRDKGNF